jgi:hypothetical protein
MGIETPPPQTLGVVSGREKRAVIDPICDGDVVTAQTGADRCVRQILVGG